MKGDGKMKCIYFIPYATADKTIYNPLINEVGKLSKGEIKLIPLELRGEGSRRREKLYDNIEDAIEDITNQITINNKEGYEVYLYGHCMGGVIAYGIYRKMKENNSINLKKIILGSVGVNIKSNLTFDQLMNNYIEEHINGVVKSENEKLMQEVIEYYKARLKQSFDILGEYYRHEKFIMDENIIMINGKQDPNCDVESMKQFIEGYDKVTQYMLEGEHLFLFKQIRNVSTIIYNEVIKKK